MLHINAETLFRHGIGAAPTHPVNRATPGDREEPAERPPAIRGIAPRFTPNLHQAFLQHVVCFSRIVQNLKNHFFQGPTVTSEQRADGGVMSVGDGLHQFLIGGGRLREICGVNLWPDHDVAAANEASAQGSSPTSAVPGRTHSRGVPAHFSEGQCNSTRAPFPTVIPT